MKHFSRLLSGILSASLLAIAIMGTLPVSTARAAPITYTVNNLGDTDDGTCDSTNCTLREAINAANANDGDDQIVFTAGLTGPIALDTSLPIITDNLVVDGQGAKITLEANGVRILVINSGVTVTVNAITFANGNDIVLGGAIFNNGTLTVTNSTFSDNKAFAGGGIANLGTLTIANSTFSGNNASGYGGGVYNEMGMLTIINNTFSGNSASKSGGGVYNKTGATLNYANTIIANSVTGGDCVNAGTLTTNTNNLVEDHSCNSTFDGDPMLDALADNGGSTLTFDLLPDSLARDAGLDAVCAAAPVNNLDQRGETRPDGPHCDIGAFEAEFISILTITPDALDFGEQIVGTTSDAQTVTVKNTKVDPVAIDMLDISGEFMLASNDCNGKTLNQNQTCSFGVRFSPTSDGAKTGMVTILDNVPTVLATLTMSGSGISPAVGLSTTSLIFAPQFIGTTSAAQTVTLTNVGTGTLEIGTLPISGDFSFRTNTCNGASLPAAGTCSFSVMFSPRDIGVRTGMASIPSNAATSPDRVTLRGTIKEGTQLLQMGNFDTVVTPIPWVVNSPIVSLVNLRDNSVYYSPSYSAKFVGYRTNPALSAVQMISRTGRAGDKFYISLSSRASNVPTVGLYQMTVTFHNGFTLIGSKTLNFTNGTHYFQTLSYYYTAPSAYTRITFNFTYQKTSGIAWFDNAAVILLP
ncbi:MAG: choice-of-anchor D domain-containing protein [Chloroflexota bacterium]